MANLVKSPIFRHPQIGSFFQIQPVLENPFLSDGFLRRTLQRLLPPELNELVSRDLTRFGDRIISEIEALSDECEKNLPYLEQWDPWGRRVDRVVTCPAWKMMKTIVAQEGIISIGYDPQYLEYGRLYQFAKAFLFAPSSAFFSCPVAATDGAAKTIKTFSMSSLSPIFNQVTSTDPSTFWTSGQWMTERKGGSDVGSGTETVAIPREDGKYSLHGYKWFTSVMDADMSITLARVVDPEGNVKPGTSGLSMFYVRTHTDTGLSNNIQAIRLKNKLGTRQLPTGELLLDGAESHLISEIGRGISSITPMLLITRLHNACQSVSEMRRVLSLARDYSQRRVCFGLKISKYPLHISTIATLELEVRGGTALLFECIRLLGLVESGVGNEDEGNYLRILTPLVKLYTAKKGMGVMSEGLELFGGQGYIEDTGIPRHFRDAQVLPIWEGTTNILSLDVLRAIGKSKGQVLNSFERVVKKSLEFGRKSKLQKLVEAAKIIEMELDKVVKTLKEHLIQESSARLYAFTLAQVAIGSLLIEHASSKEANKSDITTAIRWAQRLPKFEEQLALESESLEDSNQLVFDSFK